MSTDNELEIAKLKHETAKLNATSDDASIEKLRLKLTTVSRIIVALIRSTSIIIPAWFAYKSVSLLAGRMTIADFTFDIGGVSISLNVAITFSGWLFGAGGLYLYGKERSLKQATVEKMSNRIEGLEQRLDPDRSSSLLSKDGTTNPEDL